MRPADHGGLIVELPGRVAWLPLGPIDLGARRAAIENTEDGWLELRLPRGQTAILGDLRVDGAVQLLMGDELFDVHGGNLLLRVVPPPGERP